MFSYHSINKSSGSIFFNDNLIAEIRDLCLCNVRFKSDGKILIGSDVPIPLYWRQYANHEHPERNAGSDGSIELIEATGEKLIITCCGTSKSEEVSSTYRIEISYSNVVSSFVFDIIAELKVLENNQWFVTHNPHHGELEFCNIYPIDTFVMDKTSKKQFGACFISRKNGVIKIPHHHLESSDKHNIELNCGDTFLYLLEDENLIVEIISDDLVTAGVCAYMWDTHFAYRICNDGDDKYLPEKFSCSSHFNIYCVDREAGEKIVHVAKELIVPELENTPIYVDGVNAFSQTFLLFPDKQIDIWPWTNEVVGGTHSSVEFTYDREIGYNDNASLKIQTTESATARWLATTLGPAFGGEKFQDSCRYKLSAYIKTDKFVGEACIAIRLHREGIGSVFDLESYELYFSDKRIYATTDWTYIEIITPIISPAPDRVHLILQQNGKGTTWFDNVLFEKLI